MGSETRQRTRCIDVRVSPEEIEAINEEAAEMGWPGAAAMLRDLALNYEPTGSAVDFEAVQAVTAQNQALAKIGQRLRAWLDDGADDDPAAILAALERAHQDLRLAIRRLS